MVLVVKFYSEQIIGYSGADMRQLCSEAAMGPIREIDTMEGADIETFPIEKVL